VRVLHSWCKVSAFFEEKVMAHQTIDGPGVPLPRRKYGHLVRPHQPVAKEKCRLCRLGYTCPVHMDTEEVQRRRAEANEIRASKEAKRAAKEGKRKGRNRV
jgi:hypothetical protein